MKKLFTLVALATTGAFAQTTTGLPAFQITGNMNAGVVFNNYKGNPVNGFEQSGMGTSKLIFQGSHDLGGGLSAYFVHTTDWQLMTVRGDTGVVPTIGTTSAGSAVKTNSGIPATFGNDQKMVGLRGSFGDIAFGTINNSGAYNYVGLISPIAGTSYGSGYNVVTAADPTMTGVRWDNTFQYKTPNIGGYVGTLQYVAKQTPYSAVATAAAPINYVAALGAYNMDGVLEMSVLYAKGPLTAAFTSTRTDGVSGAIGSVNTLNALGAQYEISSSLMVTAGVENVTVGALGGVGAKRQDRQRQQPQQLGMRPGRGRLPDRPGAKRRRRAHGFLRAAVRPRGCLAMGARSDLGRQPPRLLHGQLLRPTIVHASSR